MPQLMPLMWISSSVMIILLFFVFINIYFMKMFFVESMCSNIINKNFYLKW